MNKKSILQRVFHFPLTKIVVGLVICLLVAGLGKNLILKILSITSFENDIKKLISGIIVAVMVIVAYTLLFKYYEKRKVTEFSKNRIGKHIFWGILLGLVLQSLTILVIYINGGYEVVSINSMLFIIPPLTIGFTSAVIEEILFRGIIFRIAEESLGSYFALFISAILFGALHLTNPNSSLIAGIGLAIQAGLLLGAAYIYSRNLWFPIAIHFAWNFSQSAIYGAAVSGKSISKTLITSKIEGAEWYTGGSFGPEGSIQATLFCLIATIILLILSHQKGNIIDPFWKRGTNRIT